MAKYVVWLRGHKEVAVDVVVEAKSEDKAAEAAIRLVECDRWDSLDWQEDSGVMDPDVDSVEDADENDELTEVRL